MTSISSTIERLNEIFGEEAIISRADIIRYLQDNHIDVMFPDRSKKYLGLLNLLLNYEFVDIEDDDDESREWILHIKNLKSLVKNIILEEFHGGIYSTLDFKSKVFNFLENNYFRTSLKNISFSRSSSFDYKFGDYVVELIQKLIKSDNSFRIEGDVVDENKKSVLGKSVRVIGAIQTDILSDIVSILLDSPNEQITPRAVLNKLNSSTSEYYGYTKPITMLQLSSLLTSNANKLGVSQSNGLIKLNNHPKLIWNKLSDIRFSYFDLIANLNEFNLNCTHYIGIWVTDVNIFGQDLYEYVDGLPLIYVTSTREINKLFSKKGVFLLHRENDFMINLLTLALNQSRNKQSNFYNDFKLIDGFPDEDCINSAFTFGVYSVSNSSDDLTSTLLTTYFPLLNFTNIPAHPYYEFLSSVRQNFISSILDS